MSEQPLNVTIIGAGIAGTTAARVLREKHNVTILERSSSGHEIGAAINIGPNGSRVLDSLGFDRKRAKSVIVGEALTFNKDGKVLQSIDFSNIHRTFGGYWIFQHRVDLWNELLRLATASSEDSGIPGNPAKVIWGAEVTDVDVESGLVTLADGRHFESDLVIGNTDTFSKLSPVHFG
jgi:salicylate hydroxylase